MSTKRFDCFIHVRVQEFLAAMYAFHEFAGNSHDTLRYFKPKKGKFSSLTNLSRPLIVKMDIYISLHHFFLASRLAPVKIS